MNEFTEINEIIFTIIWAINIICVILVLFSYFVYIPLFMKLVKKHDYLLYTKLGGSYILTHTQFTGFATRAFDLIPKSNNEKIRSKARTIRIILTYPLIIMTIGFISLAIIHYVSS